MVELVEVSVIITTKRFCCFTFSDGAVIGFAVRLTSLLRYSTIQMFTSVANLVTIEWYQFFCRQLEHM